MIEKDANAAPGAAPEPTPAPAPDPEPAPAPGNPPMAPEIDRLAEDDTPPRRLTPDEEKALLKDAPEPPKEPENGKGKGAGKESEPKSEGIGGKTAEPPGKRPREEIEKSLKAVPYREAREYAGEKRRVFTDGECALMELSPGQIKERYGALKGPDELLTPLISTDTHREALKDGGPLAAAMAIRKSLQTRRSNWASRRAAEEVGAVEARTEEQKRITVARTEADLAAAKVITGAEFYDNINGWRSMQMMFDPLAVCKKFSKAHIASMRENGKQMYAKYEWYRKLCDHTEPPPILAFAASMYRWYGETNSLEKALKAEIEEEAAKQGPEFDRFAYTMRRLGDVYKAHPDMKPEGFDELAGAAAGEVLT